MVLLLLPVPVPLPLVFLAARNEEAVVLIPGSAVEVALRTSDGPDGFVAEEVEEEEEEPPWGWLL